MRLRLAESMVSPSNKCFILVLGWSWSRHRSAFWPWHEHSLFGIWHIFFCSDGNLDEKSKNRDLCSHHSGFSVLKWIRLCQISWSLCLVRTPSGSLPCYRHHVLYLTNLTISSLTKRKNFKFRNNGCLWEIWQIFYIVCFVSPHSWLRQTQNLWVYL